MLRRRFLERAGVVTLLATNGQIWRVFGQQTSEIGDGVAFAPWREWAIDAEHGPLALVHAAILSANAFNSQPWLFRASESAIEVYADRKRNLGAFDPLLREMFFSLGCALENLCVAGPPNGLRPSVAIPAGSLKPSPDGAEPELAVRVELSKVPRVTSELFQAIPHRHTNREPFDSKRDLPPEFLSALANLLKDDTDVKVFFFTKDGDRKVIAQIIEQTSITLSSDPAVRRGMQGWYRTTAEQLNEDRDGTLVAPESKPGPSSPSSYKDLMLTGRLFGIIAVRDRYDRPQTIRAGRIWQRAHLFATARGVAARPANGAVELVDHERQLNQKPETLARLAEITGDGSWQPTFMFYMGYGTVPGVASARRGVSDVLL